MSFKDNGYSFIQNVLPKELCDIATQYALFQKMNDYESIHVESDIDGQVPGSHSVHADSLMESFLLFLKPVVEKHSQLELIPTYSMYRIYNSGDTLPIHTDRASCEISMTITLGYKYDVIDENYKWPIFIENNPIVIEHGDAVLYRGCEKEHWRESLNVGKNSYHVQLFLHYVDANGPYAEKYKYDERPSIGLKLHHLNRIKGF